MPRLRTALLALTALSALLAGGCASAPIVGTWQGRDGSNAPFNFGSVSFVADRTFTAEARYDDAVRVQSGSWSVRGDTLDLSAGDVSRLYGFRISGDELVVTDRETGRAMTLDRLRRSDR